MDAHDDYEVRTFSITEWSTRPKKFNSETFTFDEIEWHLLIFPRGNYLLKRTGHVAVYFGFTCPTEQYATSISLAFRITLIHPTDPTKNISRDDKHTFTQSRPDWGFYNLVETQRVAEFLKDDTLTLELGIRHHTTRAAGYSSQYARTTTTGYNDYWTYNSKKETGFVGLYNQGATCYMNSLLQTLFHTRLFRHVVYQMPIPRDVEPADSIPLALQRLFYNLQHSANGVSTKELTRSFGWNTVDAFVQHDAQELSRVLLDNLITKMQGTPLAEEVPQMLEGYLINFVRCRDVDYQSLRYEAFYDLSLQVKGCRDVEASLRKYLETELLDGENKYRAEHHGLQAAHKGCCFAQLPPVLHLQLCRWEYDFRRDAMTKVNDRYEFPAVLDMNPYVQQLTAEQRAELRKVQRVARRARARPKGDDKTDTGDANEDAMDIEDDDESDDALRVQDNRYLLHSVLVHSGGVHGGHYYAYIRPVCGDRWFRFDDERVTRASEQEAVADNYGGDAEIRSGYWPSTYRYKKVSNAYMLVYVRESDAARILRHAGEDDVPKHLVDRFERDRQEAERREEERRDRENKMTIKIATEEDFRKHTSKDLVDFSTVHAPRVMKDMPLRDFKALLAKDLGVPVERQRLWHMSESYTTRMLRPSAPPLPASYDRYPLQRIFSLNKQRVWLEVSERDAEPFFDPVGRGQLLLFFRFYDPAARRLAYVGKGFFEETHRVRDLLPRMRALAGLPDTTPLTVHHEIGPAHCTAAVSGDYSLYQLRVSFGMTFAFQVTLPPEEARAPMATVVHYYQDLADRITIDLREAAQPKATKLTLELSKQMAYAEVCQALAPHLAVPWDHIQLWGYSPYRELVSDRPYRLSDNPTLKQMTTTHMHRTTNILFYKIIAEPLIEYEQKESFHVPFYDIHMALRGTFEVTVPKADATAGSLLAALKEKLLAADARPASADADEEDQPAPLLLRGRASVLEVYDAHQGGRIFTILPPRTVITDQHRIMVTELPKDLTMAMPTSSYRVKVCSIDATDSPYDFWIAFHGVPFEMRVDQGETAGSVLRRIIERLRPSEKEAAQWRLVKVAYGRTRELAEQYPIDVHRWTHNEHLAIVRPHPGRRTTYRYPQQHAIQING